MKGVFFAGGTEYRLQIDGEQWRQSDTLKGTLSAAQPASGAIAQPGDLGVWLAIGNERKVKAKDPGAFEIVSEARGAGPLSWSFELGANARVTDKAGSHYLLYGSAGSPPRGQIRLQIMPRLWFEELCEILVIGHRYVRKSLHAGKGGWTEFKLAPPDGRASLAVDSLVLSLRMEGEAIQASFDFSLKEVDAKSASLALKRSQREIAREFAPSDYLLRFNGHLNKEKLEKEVDAILREATSGLALGR